MADRPPQQPPQQRHQQQHHESFSSVADGCSIIEEEEEEGQQHHHVFRDDDEDEVYDEGSEEVFEDPRHSIFASTSREDYFNDSNLSDFVVSDEEGDAPPYSSPPRHRHHHHYLTQQAAYQHHHHHRNSSFSNNTLLNLSQSSLGTANTDANATQRLLLELQRQEDTSTSFVPSVMGDDCDLDDDMVQGNNIIQEVPMNNNNTTSSTAMENNNDNNGEGGGIIDDDAASVGCGGLLAAAGRPEPITKRSISLNTPTSTSATTMIPSSAALFRYLRSLATGERNSGTTNPATTTPIGHACSNNNKSGGGDHLKNAGGGGGGASGDNDSSSSSENHELYSSSSSSSSSAWSVDHDDDDHDHQPEDNNPHHHDPATSTAFHHHHHHYSDAINVDWNQLPALPNRFCNNTKLRVPMYLDASVLQQSSPDEQQEPSPGISKSNANAFVWEHGTLLRAVLQLLAERDQVGVEGSIVATDNIWKKGSLKKLSALGLRSAGTWKVKYVEIRQGNLCYYGDSGTGQRKIIHLRQADAIVQESSLRGPGLTWELIVQGTKYYWSATSEAERQLWMKAVQNAMIGDEGPRRELDLQPYQAHLDVYGELREAVQQAESQKAYLAAIQGAIMKLASLQVPIQWVREQTERDLSPILLGTMKPPKFNTSPQKRLRSSIAEFWRMMGQTTFTINGLTVPRTSQLASERIVGALTRCILEYDRAAVDSSAEDNDANNNNNNNGGGGGGDATGASVLFSELQAVSYARDILLAVLRSRERQDIGCAVKYLLANSFVTVESTSRPMDEPVHMEVSLAGEDLPDDLPESEEMASWVWTRTRRNNISVWKQRHSYAVLSGTVLSLYEAAEPRPHGLRGQVVLDSNMTVKDYGEDLNETDSLHSKGSKARLGLCITTGRALDRLLYFDRAEDAAAWKEAIDEAIRNADSIQKPPRVVTTATTTTSPTHATLLKGAELLIKGAADGTLQTGVRVIRGAKDGGIRVIRGATNSGMRVIKTATGAGFKVVRGAVDRLRQSNAGDEGDGEEGSHRTSDGSRRPSLDILLNNTIVHGKREPTVQCVIRSTETFSIKNQGFSEHSSERRGSNSDRDPTGTSHTAEAWIPHVRWTQRPDRSWRCID
jgi:hypothetical protein